MGTKRRTSRPADIFYDPNYTVSSEYDHYKAAVRSNMSRAKYAICPIFETMFSDIPSKPRTQIIMRRSSRMPTYEDSRNSLLNNVVKRTMVDPTGAERFQFFVRPRTVKFETVPISLEITPVSAQTTERTSDTVRRKHKRIQTQYKESSMQTIPWQPDYIVTDDSDPEILKLDFLEWGAGLPAGMHEVTLIIRARMKRAWEKAMPPVTDKASLMKRKSIIQAIEEDEWRFRDQEIQDIQDLRMELLEKMLNELHEKSLCRTEKKISDYCKMKNKEKAEKLHKLKHKTERALRKLSMQQKGITETKKQSFVSMYIEKSSNIYGQKLCMGKAPVVKMEVVEEHLKKYRPDFKGVENIDTLPPWISRATEIKDCTCLKLSGTRLCIRETKWTTPILKLLHEELKDLHEPGKAHCSLRTRVVKEIPEPPTPEIEGLPQWEEEIYQASVALQGIIRGRATHMIIYKGRNRCKELIQELRSTHALQEDDRKKKFNQRLEVKLEQRTNLMCFQNATYLKEALNELAGTVVGTLLDFLNKELHRLLDERRIHAMCLFAERERHRREAAEAGRRQAELRRRKEHKEFFKQQVKMHQDTTDMFLQDIITEGMQFASKEEATDYVRKLAEKIDENAYDTIPGLPVTEQEELVATLIHEFVVAEVDKQVVRNRIKQRQGNYLKTAHEEIYNNVDALPKPKRDSRLAALLNPYDFKQMAIDRQKALLEAVDQKVEVEQMDELAVVSSPIADNQKNEKQSDVLMDQYGQIVQSNITIAEIEVKISDMEEKTEISE